jgi:hypothetical protein
MNQTLEGELDKSKQDAVNNISLEQYMSLTYKFCPTQELANFINTQISQVQKKAKGRRYSLEFKNECLAMYFTGPKLYKKKLRVQFCLPSLGIGILGKYLFAQTLIVLVFFCLRNTKKKMWSGLIKQIKIFLLLIIINQIRRFVEPAVKL